MSNSTRKLPKAQVKYCVVFALCVSLFAYFFLAITDLFLYCFFFLSICMLRTHLVIFYICSVYSFIASMYVNCLVYLFFFSYTSSFLRS